MNECIKIKTDKYTFRNSPPYPANKCKSMKKKGSDGKFYLSQPDKNGIYKWIKFNKNKTFKNKALQRLTEKYSVTKSGSNREVAERLVRVTGFVIKNKTDRKIIEQFLKKPTQYTKKWGFVPNPAK